ncbi:MAG: glycosyltransferase 4 family protein [archaeon]
MAISFLVTFIVTPVWIRRAKRAGLTGVDVHKLDKPQVAEMGGLPVLMGFLSGVLVYVAIGTFAYRSYGTSLQIMAIIASMLIIAIIGIMDDVLGWKIGIRQRQKPLLTIAAAFPLMVLNAGHSIMHIPLLGPVDFGLIFPLVIIPIGLVGAANGFNMIGGYNGLEAGLGIIILSTMGYFSWSHGDIWSSMIMFCMVFSLIAFYYYNQHPARVFPGDTLTYSVGALIAIMAVMANMERLALFLFIPYLIQFFLKLRGGMKKESFAELKSDGSLKMPYKKIYGLEHVAIRVIRIFTTVRETSVIYSLFLLELVLVGFAFLFLM